MNRSKVLALAIVTAVVSTALLGVGYSTFHATYESSNNTISVGDITAISLGKNNGGSLQEAGNSAFSCDLSMRSVTTVGGTTYSFTSGNSTATILDAYAYQKLSGAPAASGSLTLTITTPGIDWSGVSGSGMTVKAGNVSADDLTLSNGSIVASWNSVSIPAYAASPTTSSGLHIEVTIDSSDAMDISSSSSVCNTVRIALLLE